MNEEELAALNEQVVGVPCPQCGRTELTVHERLVAKPIGTFSLSGTQMKVSASWGLVLECPCGWSEVGK